MRTSRSLRSTRGALLVPPNESECSILLYTTPDEIPPSRVINYSSKYQAQHTSSTTYSSTIRSKQPKEVESPMITIHSTACDGDAVTRTWSFDGRVGAHTSGSHANATPTARKAVTQQIDPLQSPVLSCESPNNKRSAVLKVGLSFVRRTHIRHGRAASGIPGTPFAATLTLPASRPSPGTGYVSRQRAPA